MIPTARPCDVDDDATAELVDVLLPEGGCVVAMVRAFFDESFGTGDGSVLCVAGYVFRKKECVALDRAWRDVLTAHRLPFFRMSACAHGASPFKHMAMAERIEVETACIDLIKRYAAHGFAVSVVPREYNEVIRDRRLGSAYSFLTRNCLVAISTWADRESYNGKVSYFFEAGHKSQGEANGIMNRIFKLPGERVRFRYSSHAFVDKAAVRPLQAADLLAWQWFTDSKKRQAGTWTKQRADLMSLVAAPHEVVHWSRDRLLKLKEDSARLNEPIQ